MPTAPARRCPDCGGDCDAYLAAVVGLASTAMPRQTCSNCLSAVGTLPDGTTRPYTSVRPGPGRAFHYCAAPACVEAKAAYLRLIDTLASTRPAGPVYAWSGAPVDEDLHDGSGWDADHRADLDAELAEERVDFELDAAADRVMVEREARLAAGYGR